jgi:YggT family protein
MNHLLGAVLSVVSGLLELVAVLILVWAVMSWLIAFNVINTRHRWVWQVENFLDAATRPILAPFRKVIPPLGTVDITPVVVLLIIGAVQSWLIHPALIYLGNQPFP